MFWCEPSESRLENENVEVDEQADWESTEPQVSHYLSLVDWEQSFDRLQFQQNLGFDDEVDR